MGEIKMDKTHKSKFEVFTTKLDNYKILGISFAAIDLRKLGELWYIWKKSVSAQFNRWTLKNRWSWNRDNVSV